MSADRNALRSTTVLALLIGCGIAAAAEEELPDLEFLEYLGSWEESDEDWLLFREFMADPAASDENEKADAEAAEKSAAVESTESE